MLTDRTLPTRISEAVLAAFQCEVGTGSRQEAMDALAKVLVEAGIAPNADTFGLASKSDHVLAGVSERINRFQERRSGRTAISIRFTDFDEDPNVGRFFDERQTRWVIVGRRDDRYVALGEDGRVERTLRPGELADHIAGRVFVKMGEEILMIEADEGYNARLSTADGRRYAYPAHKLDRLPRA